MANPLLRSAALGAALLACAGACWAADADSKAFIAKAIQGNFAEIEMGKLAQQKGASAAVKDYGKMLQVDHSGANEKAMQAASKMGVKPPSGPSLKQKTDLGMLSKEEGGNFDTTFVTHMVEDHKDDISAYETEKEGNKDAAAQYATDTLPILQKHLDQAQSMVARPK